MNPFKKTKQHLDETNWSYRQHLSHSVKQSNRLIVVAIKSYLHGLMPWLFSSSGPIEIYKIYKEIRNMHHVQKIFQAQDQINNQDKK